MTRATAVAIGIIALLIGVLILCKAPVLSALGTTAGWSFCAVGSTMLLASGCVQCHKKEIEEDGIIDFSQITPANYEQYLDVSQRGTAKKGDFVFTKNVHQHDFPVEDFPPHCQYKQGDVYLGGEIQYLDQGWYGGGGLEIRNGEFIHYPQMNGPPEHFSNLKDFFNYLFRGIFYQGECTRGMDFFTLRTKDGREVRYNNPYKCKFF